MHTSQILMLGRSPACLRATRALAELGFPVVRAADGTDLEPRGLEPALVIADAEVAAAAEQWQGAPLIVLAQLGHQTLPGIACAELFCVPVAPEQVVAAVKRRLHA